MNLMEIERVKWTTLEITIKLLSERRKIIHESIKTK